MLSPIHTTIMYFPERVIAAVVAFIIIHTFFLNYQEQTCKIRCRGKYHKWLSVFLLDYCYALLFFTLLGRRSKGVLRYDLQLFHSYAVALEQQDMRLFLEILANIVVFIPVGALAAYLAEDKKWICGIGKGLALSLFIEGMQFLLRNGLFELDDIMNNVLGTLLGCMISLWVLPGIMQCRKQD